MRGRSLVSGPRPVCIALVALLTAAPSRGDTVIGSGVLTTDTVWDAAGSPYIVGFLRVQGTDGADGVTTLTVEPGVVVKSFGRITIGGTGGSDPPGALVADAGGSIEPILFTSDQDVPAPGDWCGVLLAFRAHDSTFLRNVRIEYGGSSCESSPAQLIDRRPGGASVTLEDVTFADSSSADLKVETADLTVQDSTLDSVILRDAARVVFDGNTFLDWGEPLSTVNLASLDSLSHGNTFVPPPGEEGRLQVEPGTVEVDAAWGPDPGVYLMPFVSVAGTDGPDGVTTLTLEPGIELRFQPPADLRIGEESPSGAPGRLVSDGGKKLSEDEGILMASSADPPATGDWSGVRVLQTGSARLRSTWLRHASTAVSVEGGALESVERVTIESSTTGLSLLNATLGAVLEGLDVSGAETAVSSSGSTPVMRRSSLLGSVWGVNNVTPAAVVDARESWWGAADGPSGVGPGSGAAVSAGVLFDPWLAAPPRPRAVPALSAPGLSVLAIALCLGAALVSRRQRSLRPEGPPRTRTPSGRRRPRSRP